MMPRIHFAVPLRLVGTLILLVPCRTLAQNLALHREYTFSRPPDYAGCTDPGDLVQLTDGKLTVGRLWTDRGAVGWTSAVPRPVRISLDLGAVEPIEGAAYSTAADGHVGARWPRALDVFVSADRKTWAYAGDLRKLDSSAPLDAQTYARHRYVAHGWHGRGRYVDIIVSYDNYAFADEIEIYRDVSGQASTLKPDIVDPDEFVWRTKRLLHDIDVVREQHGPSLAKAPAFVESLRVAAGMARPSEAKVSKGESSILPVSAIQARIFALRGGAIGAQGARLIAWKKNRYDPLDPIEAPPGGPHPVLDIKTPRMAWRADSFILTNASSQELHLRLRVIGLEKSGARLVLRKVPFVDSAPGIDVAAPLIEMKRGAGGDDLAVPAGMNQEVWLISLPANGAPGTYTGYIQVSAVGVPEVRIPVQLSISKVQLPTHLKLHLGGWDYTDADASYDVTPRNRDALTTYLQQRFIDVTWARGATVLPSSADFTKDDELSGSFNWRQFDAWVRRWPYASRFFVFLAVKDSFAGARISTPSFQRRVAAWARAWAAHIRQLGRDPAQFGVLFVDEPTTTAQAELIDAWSESLRSARAGILVFEEPSYSSLQSAAAQRVMRASDIVSPTVSKYLRMAPKERSSLLPEGPTRRLWLYDAQGPVRTLDPYSYYRLTCWLAFQSGAEGVQFWSLADAGGAGSWNERASKSRGYAPEYLGSDAVDDSKHMFALIEGAEDYEILAMLASRVAVGDAQPQRSALLADARSLLATGPAEVLGGLERAPDDAIRWDSPKDRSIADRLSRRALELLEALGGP